MRESYVRRKKNRTRTLRILENMRRPSVILESLPPNQSLLLDDAFAAWNEATGLYMK